MSSTTTATTITRRLEVIDPDRARKLLDGHVNYRPLSALHAKKLAEEITAGRWTHENGSSVKIDVNGHLCDGRHRCLAVTIADKAILTWVEYGIPLEAVAFIDSDVRPRTASDVLNHNEVVNAKDAAAGARVIMRWMSPAGFAQNPPISNSAVVEFVMANRDEITVAARTAQQLRRAIGTPARETTAFHFLARRVDPETADRFMESLTSGAGLGEDDPILALRNWMVNKAANRIQVTSEERCHAYAKAWVAWRQGRPMKLMKVMISGRNDTRTKVPELI